MTEQHTTAEVRVGLAEDDDLVRAGIASILQSDDAITVVAEARDGHQALEIARRHRLDVLLLDIRMPTLDGLSALDHLRREHPALPVAMLTTFADEDYIAAAIGSGALGFLLKSDGARELIAAVRAIAGGGAAFSPRVARWLVRSEATSRIREGSDARAVVARLTERQRELLAALGPGASNADIARTLHLSDGTVKQYLRTLFDALGVGNRVQAAILAHRAGLSDDNR